METQYTALSKFYDMLTEEVEYEKWADYIEKIINRFKAPKDIVLELGAGTGSLSKILWQRGYDLICVDNSEEMLSIAQEKYEGEESSPLFLCQDMCQLDLYGTIDIALCCLDSLNYLTYVNEVKKTFQNVSLFMNKGGLFIFDIKTKGAFGQLKGEMNAVSLEDGFYFWQYDYDNKSGLCQHNIELFEKDKIGYNRHIETHFQRAYGFSQIEKLLKDSGFEVKGRYKEIGRAHV